MSETNYEMGQGVPYRQNLPPYSENQGHEKADPLQPPHGPELPMAYGATPPVPPQYQPYPGPPGAGPGQGPDFQPMQPIYITPVQPTNEPSYLCYSIFTTIFCCLPLGIAAIVYSVLTRSANQAGNLPAAQKNSRIAHILANTALGVGIGVAIIYTVLILLMRLS